VMLMVASSLVATCLTPRARWYDILGQPNYATMLPTDLDEWRDEGQSSGLVVSPVETEAVGEIYSQVVSRTYVHKPTGRRIMLSLAYVASQHGPRQLHRPESCYSSQGFRIGSLRAQELDIADLPLNAFRLSAVMAGRNEQVTYWIRVGDRTVGGSGYHVNLTRMGMALGGYVADGLLFRVSEIATDPDQSNLLQDQFVADLLRAMTPAQKRSLIGQRTPS
jgi:EpsI family protein